MTMITLWINPEEAAVKYECKKPSNWDDMDEDEKINYFSRNMVYTDYVIGKNPDPNWQNSVDPDLDFEEED